MKYSGWDVRSRLLNSFVPAIAETFRIAQLRSAGPTGSGLGGSADPRTRACAAGAVDTGPADAAEAGSGESLPPETHSPLTTAAASASTASRPTAPPTTGPRLPVRVAGLSAVPPLSLKTAPSSLILSRARRASVGRSASSSSNGAAAGSSARKASANGPLPVRTKPRTPGYPDTAQAKALRARRNRNGTSHGWRPSRPASSLGASRSQ